MQIFVDLDTGTNLTLDVEPTDTIQNLLGQVQTKTGIMPDMATLVFGGQELLSNHTLADYNIQKLATISEYTYPDMDGFSSTSTGSTNGSSSGSGPGAKATAACFLKGTLIGTPKGDFPIETLKAGDWAFFIPYAHFRKGRTHPGLAQVRWVAHKHVPAPGKGETGDLPSNCPVRMRQGAFDGERPHQDLFVTGHHQVLAHQDLAPAGGLVDGEAVTWHVPAGAMDLFHLEFDGFGLVFANGVACETFLDVGNRKVFDNDDCLAGSAS